MIGLFVLVTSVIGIPMVVRAQTSTAMDASPSFEAEVGTLTGCATKTTDSTASKSGAAKYSSCATTTTPVITPTTQFGAQLPISYALSSLTGNIYYVATNGSDTNTGTINSPFATLSKAISTALTGSSIVIRNGTYRNQGKLAIASNKSLHIIAYPGETPVFDGSQVFASGWSTDGTLSYHSYTAITPSDGSGDHFSTTNQNLTSSTNYVGKLPDQAWVGATTLQQVSTKAAVTAGKFYVDSSAGRMYLSSSDVAKGNVTASQQQKFVTINSSNTKIEGLTITKYSDTASDNGVILINPGANSVKLTNVVVSENSFFAIELSGGRTVATIMQNPTFDHITVTGSNFMGIESTFADNFTVSNSKLDNLNRFGEFTSSPVSGAIKTSRSHGIFLLNNEIANNKSHGLWFDQSNEDIVIANSQFTGNTGDAVFFEISDNLYMINNYIDNRGGGQGLKAAGSSGIHLIANTFVGGADPIGIYTDSRSLAGCSDPATKPICPAAAEYPSVVDTVHPHLATLDWMPRIDLMINNVIAYPTGSNYCGVVTAVCITLKNGDSVRPIETIIHKADSRGIPQSQIDGNIYAPASNGVLMTVGSTKYTTISSFTSAMAASPVSIGGIDSNSKLGSTWVSADGKPTAALTASNGSAVAVPVNTEINRYISAGTKHYGYTFQ